MLSILLLHQFLAGVLGGEDGLASHSDPGRSGHAPLSGRSALCLLATFLAAAAIGFYNTVARDRLVRSIELRVMEHLVRHLMTLSVLAIDGHSPGDILEAVRHDVGRLRTVLVAIRLHLPARSDRNSTRQVRGVVEPRFGARFIPTAACGRDPWWRSRGASAGAATGFAAAPTPLSTSSSRCCRAFASSRCTAPRKRKRRAPSSTSAGISAS